jgi:hypothetical protein
MPLPDFKLRDAEDETDRKLLSDIEKFGWHVVHVNSGDDGPGFSFSVGFYYILLGKRAIDAWLIQFEEPRINLYFSRHRIFHSASRKKRA